MKKTFTISILLLTLLLSCERDDICPEDKPTTPRLVIDFKSVINPESSENVFSFRAEDANNPENVLSSYDDVTASQVILPLKTTEDSTQFALYENYGEIDDNDTPDDDTDDIQLANKDIITITYARENVYVSRACGYKTIFKNVVITIENDIDNWLQIVDPINDNTTIEDETATHFNIRH